MRKINIIYQEWSTKIGQILIVKKDILETWHILFKNFTRWTSLYQMKCENYFCVGSTYKDIYFQH